jgi:hypothetical protein
MFAPVCRALGLSRGVLSGGLRRAFTSSSSSPSPPRKYKHIEYAEISDDVGPVRKLTVSDSGGVAYDLYICVATKATQVCSAV